jgi:catechol 2,3-dioxygenase-like lactoylglutathione lyase family enzyme
MFTIIRFLSCLAAVCMCSIASVNPQTKPQATPPAHSEHTKESSMNFHKIIPNLMVADMEKSLVFYRDVLGFTVAETVPDKPPFVFAWMKRGDAELFLNQHTPPQPGQPDPFSGRQIGGTLSLYLPLQGIDELLKTLEARGVKIAIPIHKEFYGMREFAVYDPDGYLIIFAERAN